MATTAARIAAANLRVDAITAEVVRAFGEAGIECRLLKGASIARWLYSPSDPRGYGDCDLLLRPTDLAAARSTLTHLGFAPDVDETQMPEWWREHAVGWVRPGDAVVVDIHRTLPGVGAAEQVWEVLSDSTERIEVGGVAVTTLAPAGRALHISLHAAQHGPGWGGAVADDLTRALAIADEETWRTAASLAERLDATAAFAAGLRLAPQGAALADRLALPDARPADVALRLQGAPPVSLGLDQLAKASGPVARLRLLGRKAFPPRTFMRKWFPRAAHSRWAMVLAYLWRPVWLLRHAPAGVRAWLQARRGTTPS